MRSERSNVQDFGDTGGVSAGMFKRAGKLGQEDEQAMQVPIPPSPGHFSAINFSAKSQQTHDATLPKLVPVSMSATSPNRAALRAFRMNDSIQPAAAKRLAIRTDPVRRSVAIDCYVPVLVSTCLTVSDKLYSKSWTLSSSEHANSKSSLISRATIIPRTF